MPTILEQLFETLPQIPEHHMPTDGVYRLFKQIARREIEQTFGASEAARAPFAPFGDVVFPYFKMGAVDSLNLFDLDELIIFSFYWRSKGRYRTVADIGANIGLHSILLAKCGFQVRAYEPDPVHFSVLRRNLDLNDCKTVETIDMAVSSRTGETEFVRVLGNTTSSHLSGAKMHPYGKLERFPVKLEAISNIIAWADLIKLDAEGHEPQIVCATSRDDWTSTDAFIEVENAENGALLFDHFQSLGVNMFSQKTGWRPVRRKEDIPAGYRDGMLFVSCRDRMPWQD